METSCILFPLSDYAEWRRRVLAKGTIVNRRNYMKCFDGESREVSTECHNTFRGVGKKGFFDDK